MSNVKSVPNCPHCKTVGTVNKDKGLFVSLECPKCKFTWATLSKGVKRSVSA
jgi:ssDNA-binding Zn-finger/Zn-ribbon topoisomerase 1